IPDVATCRDASPPTLSQCGDDRPQAHLPSEALCGTHLLGIECADQRTRGDRKPLNGRAVEHNRYDTVAEATHEPSRFRRGVLPAREVTQRCLDWRPIGLLRRGQFEHALDTRNID